MAEHKNLKFFSVDDLNSFIGTNLITPDDGMEDLADSKSAVERRVGSNPTLATRWISSPTLAEATRSDRV